MKKTLLAIPAFMAALAIAPMVSTSVHAQDADKGDSAEKADAKSYDLLQKWEKGDIFSLFRNSTATSKQVITMPDGTENEQGGDIESEEDVSQFEILEVAEDGSVTKLSILWHSGSKLTTTPDPVTGESSEDTTESEYTGLKITYTWDEDSKAWTGEHDEGGEDLTEAQINDLAKNQQMPITDVRLPGKAVAVGDEWEYEEDIIKTIFTSMLPAEAEAQLGSMTMTERKGSGKVEEAMEADGIEYLKLSFSVSMKIDTEQQGMKLSGPITVDGEFYFDLTNHRVVESTEVVGVEINVEGQGMKISVNADVDQSRILYKGKADDLLAEAKKAEEEAEGDDEGDSEDKEDAPATPEKK